MPRLAPPDGWRRPLTRDDARFDAVVAGALLALAALTAPLFAAGVAHPPPWWAYAGWVVAVTAPLALRRRHPSVVAVVVMLAFVAGQVGGVPDLVVNQIAPFLALYTVGAWEDHRRRALVVRAVLIGVLAAWLVVALVGASVGPGPTGSLSRPALVVLTVLANVLYLAAAVSFGQAARLSARRLAVLEERTAELAAEREHTAATAVALERVRIARDLHDVVAHHVSVMGIHAGAARRVLTSDPAEAAASLAAVEAGARSAVEELRRTLVALRSGEDGEAAPSEAASTRGVDQLDDLVGASRRAGTPAALVVEGARRPLPPAVDITLYRVVQEALTNVRRHAGDGAAARVVLRYLPGAVEVEVDDRGGAAPGGGPQGTGGTGLGLVGVRERLATVGGGVEAGATGHGYRVLASVPLPREPLPAGPGGVQPAGRAAEPAAAARP